MKKIILLVLIFCCQSFNARADDADLAALVETQNLLKDSARVQKEALLSPAALKADNNANITGLGNPAHKQEIYNISSDLMTWFVDATQGDPVKMEEFITEAQKNPEAFYERFPASEKARIKSLSESIESTLNKPKTP